MKLDDTGCLTFCTEQGARHTARQAIPTYYFRNGICYSATRDTVVRDRQVAEPDCVGVVVDGPIANIDEAIELEWAEYLAQRLGEQCS